MAKDGTNRGGRRVRAGDKPQPLADKITAGKAAKILEAPELHIPMKTATCSDIYRTVVPILFGQ